MVPFRDDSCVCGARAARACSTCGRPVCNDLLCVVRATGECFRCGGVREDVEAALRKRRETAQRLWATTPSRRTLRDR